MGQQTSYLNNPAPALNGMSTMQEGEVVWSKVASGVVPIGLLAKFGSQSLSVPGTTLSTATAGSAGTVIAFPASVTDDPLLETEYIGIPLLDMARMQADQITTFVTGTLSVSAYADKIAVPVMRKGRLWVLSENATSQFGDVYVRVTAGANNPRGQFSYQTGTTSNLVKFSKGRWLMTTTGAGVSLLEIW